MAPDIKVLQTQEQYSTFKVAGSLYGIDVTRVQEVVRSLPMTEIPLAASHVRGLINLRGQVATAIGLRELFSFESNKASEAMNVVCNFGGSLISLLVDEIGDVIEVARSTYEPTPPTIPEHLAKYMSGVYKLKDGLLSIVNIDLLFESVNS